MEKRAAQRQARRSPVPEPVSSKMADMILHENNCDGNSRASGTAAPVRAALTGAGIEFLAMRGTRHAKPSDGFPR